MDHRCINEHANSNGFHRPAPRIVHWMTSLPCFESGQLR
ncbi:unnamed protein product [Rhodiola kirilowii]